MERDRYTRVDRVRTVIDGMIKNIADEEDKRCAYVHLYGVGLMAAFIALKRGLSRETAELAEIAGMMHDLAVYVGLPADSAAQRQNAHEHAHFCADLARDILDGLDCFSGEEKELVCGGIYNHSDKHITGSDFDEIIKDADAMQHAMRDPAEDYYYMTARVQKLLGELL